jgi:hypothetical protein
MPHISDPDAAAWSIQVIASNIAQGPQGFALVYIGHFGQAEENDLISP